MVKQKIDPKDKIKVISDYIGGIITREMAADKLECRQETVSRLKNKLLTEGKDSFIHGNKGRVSEKRIDKELEDRIVSLFNTKYYGFNFSHFYDMLVKYREADSLPAFRTVCRILERNSIVSPRANKTKRKANEHPLRDRRLGFGELVQLDASKHIWLANGIKYTLYIAIDDATSMILGAHFEKEETTHGYLELLKQIIDRYGIPKCFYTDNRGTFIYKAGKSDIDANVQFRNACNKLGIDIITTSVAQAKGRVERSFSTHQDRLVNELRLHNITTIDETNIYLEEYVDYHNAKFSLPVSKQSFTPLDKNIDLNYVLITSTNRKILNGNVVSYKNNQYMPYKVDDTTKMLSIDTPVEVIETFDNKLLIKHNDNYYNAKLVREGRASAHTPPKTHPWRQGYGKTIKEQDATRKHRHK
jgi:hypothetical protein